MIFVDQYNDGKFAYTNSDGEIEGVLLSERSVSFCCDSDLGTTMTVVWPEDIPKMIKALEAAYSQYTKGKL